VRRNGFLLLPLRRIKEYRRFRLPIEAGRMLSATLNENRKLFERHGFFSQLSQRDLDSLLSHARNEHYRARQLIFARGSPGRSMMAVLCGSVKISLPSVAGREVVLAILEAGEIFGEMALLDGSERTADATALTDCDLLVIDQRDFVPFLESRADLCIVLLKLLCRRLRQTNEHVEGALFERLDTRLARALVRLSVSSDGTKQGPRRVHITQSELAGMLGAARESVNKHLHAWQRAGLLELGSREILIPDLSAIERLA
jgi:CRP/FNR family transcriptional regulator, cyclic AMP receptor protein